MGQKTHEKIFPETKELCEQKMLGKKSSEKSAKNFFYIHTNTVTKKWGGEKARNNFSRNTRIVRAKLLGKKFRKKLRKTFFYIHTNIETKKCGAKNS